MGDLKDVGLSLFQGGESLHIDHSSQRQEEDEAEEDQRRRKEELQSILTKAFEDMSYDDDDDGDDDEDDDDDEEDDDDDDDCDDDDVEIVNGNSNFKSNLTDAHRGINSGFGSKNDFRLLPPRPVTEGSVVIPESNNPLSPRTNRNNNVLPPAVSQEADEYLPPHLAYSPGGGFGAPTKECIPSAPLGNLQNNHHNRVLPSVPETVDHNEIYRQTGFNSIEQLQVLYEVRSREVQRLTQELGAARSECAAEIDSLYRRVALREAERDRAVIQLKNAQSLLVESKGKIKDLQNEVETLKKSISNLETSRTQLETQLAAAQSSATELQHKVLTLERSRLGDGEALLRQAEERHRRDMERLQRQAEDRAAHFKEQEKELLEREARLREQNRQQERLLVEKSEAVSALARQLEEAQREWGRRLAEGGELADLRASLTAADSECRRLGQQLAEAQREAEKLRLELQQYEALDSFGLLSSSHFESTSSTGGVGFHAKIRQELQRSLANQKVKREEIHRLQESLKEKDKELSALKKQQELYLEEANKFKDEAEKLYGQLLQQADIDEQMKTALQAREQAESQLQGKEAEIAKLQERLHDAEQKLKEQEGRLKSFKETAGTQSREEFMKFHEQVVARVRREHDTERVQFCTQLEQVLKESDQVKQMYVEVCASKEELVRSLQVERDRSASLQARLDSHVSRISLEIDRAKQEAMATITAESPGRADTREASVGTDLISSAVTVSEGSSCSSCESLRQSVSFLEGRTEGLVKELSRRQQELRDGRAQVASLQRDLADAAAERERLQREMEQLRKGVEDATHLQIVKMETELCQLRKELEMRHKSNGESKNDDTSSLAAEMEKLTLELASAKETGSASQKEVLKLKAEVTHLQDEISQLKSDIEAAKNLRDCLSEKERELETARKDADEASLRLTAELAAARGLCNQLADKLKESRVDRRDSATSTESEFPSLEELQARHRAEIERVKDQTVDFFANQVLLLKEQHRASVAKVEQLHAEGLQAARLTTFETREQVANLRRDKEEADKHLAHLQKTLNEVKADLTRVRSKYHTTKKVVQDYKVWAAKREEHYRQEWQRLEAGYRESLLKLQQRMDEMLSQQKKS